MPKMLMLSMVCALCLSCVSPSGRSHDSSCGNRLPEYLVITLHKKTHDSDLMWLVRGRALQQDDVRGLLEMRLDVLGPPHVLLKTCGEVSVGDVENTLGMLYVWGVRKICFLGILDGTYNRSYIDHHENNILYPEPLDEGGNL